MGLVKCTNCEQLLLDDSMFCSYCGKSIERKRSRLYILAILIIIGFFASLGLVWGIIAASYYQLNEYVWMGIGFAIGTSLGGLIAFLILKKGGSEEKVVASHIYMTP